MLILSRKEGQRLIFTLADGREIEVEVVRIKGKQVTLGVEAAKDIPVVRGEIRRVA